jgi:hypothetical protein
MDLGLILMASTVDPVVSQAITLLLAPGQESKKQLWDLFLTLKGTVEGLAPGALTMPVAPAIQPAMV